MKSNFSISSAIRVILPLMLFVVLWFFLKDKFFAVDDELNRLECKAKSDAMRARICGKVVSKFRNDKLDGIRELHYTDGNDTLLCKIFYYEIDQFYDFILVNDSIIKLPGSLDVRITGEIAGDKRDTTHTLRFNCREVEH